MSDRDQVINIEMGKLLFVIFQSTCGGTFIITILLPRYDANVE